VTPPTTRTIIPDRGDDRERLDRVLLRHLADLAGVSRSRIQEWIREGRVRVDGRPGKPSEKVKRQETIEVLLPPPAGPRPDPEPQDIPLSVLFEDSHILVLDKPAGLVVHPAVGHRDGTLVNALLHRSREWAGPADRPGLVHRLDKDTSGLLVIAKTDEAMTKLARGMKERLFEKEYLAVVYGSPAVRKGRVDLGILRDPRDRKRMAASKSAGRPSTTVYELLGESSGSRSGLSLLRCRLVTGRTHQIRVHLKAIHLPVVGDPVYASTRWKGIRDEALREACRTFPRQALHSWRLSFAHPATGEALSFAAPVTDDIRRLLAAASVALPLV
jgi:23S rRNA pseudouridine1911/1915/1917 synthase